MKAQIMNVFKLKSVRKLLFFTTLLCLCLYGLSCVSNTNNPISEQVYILRTRKKPQLSDSKIVRSTVYGKFLPNQDLPKFVGETSLHERCMSYFNALTLIDPMWMIDPHANIPLDESRFKSYDSYYQEVMKEERFQNVEARVNSKTYRPLSEAKIRANFEAIWQVVLDDEQKLHDYVTHARVFDKCFLNGPVKSTNIKPIEPASQQPGILEYKLADARFWASKTNLKEEIECSVVEGKVFPWLTGNFPKYTRWDGKSVAFPEFSQGTSEETSEKTQSLEPDCFLQKLKSRLNGRGIVMTVSDSHVEDARRLIRLLRHLGNTYPVQIVHVSELSKESINTLVLDAQNDFQGYSKQDLWFVDAQDSIKSVYMDKFESIGHKIIATLFNSFEDMLLCDADTVFLVNPSHFFETEKYLSKGALFYKDRSLSALTRKDREVFFKKLLPSKEDSAIFNIPQATKVTLDNALFKGYMHFVLGGVVAVNRKKHFLQPLMMATMQFYTPVTARVYGDKELYWLALSVSGDESYAFNDHHTAAIGEFTPESERINAQGIPLRSKEICSSHPGHISDGDNQTLLWFSSGFRQCQRTTAEDMDWASEFNHKTRYTNLMTLDEFKTFFRSTLKITHAIIPPIVDSYGEFENDDGEPMSPWEIPYYCQRYNWCASSLVGGNYVKKKNPGNNVKKGTVVAFSPEQIASFEAAGDIWMADLP